MAELLLAHILCIMVVIILDIGNRLIYDIDWIITLALDGGDSAFHFIGEKIISSSPLELLVDEYKSMISG